MFRVTIPRLSRTMPGLRSFSSAPYIKADIAVNAPKPRPLRPRPRTNFRSVDKGDSTLPEKVPTFNSPADAITYLNSLSNAKRSKATLQIRPAIEIFHAYIKNHENIDRHSLQLYTALLRVFTEFPVNETSKILLEIYDDVKQFVTKPNELQNLQTKFVNLLCEQHSRIQRRLEEVNDRSINERVENLESEIDSALLEIITNPNPMFRLSVESHDLVLGALAARANTEKVNEIFALMAMNKIIPSSDTFSHLVYANGKKDLEAANTWFNRYRSAPIVKTSKPYFAFASVLLENGYFNEAWELLNVTMLGDGIPFGVDALNFILGELSKNGFYEEAKTRYKQVVNEETGDLRAKLKTHMVMLRGAINNNDLDLASSILTQNKNITAIPNVGQLFSMSVEKHALDFALELAKRAIEVEPETLHRLMVGLFHKGLYDQVKEVFTTCQGKFSDEEMMALYKVGKDRSDRSCYEIAIEAMLKTRKEQDVLYAKNVAIEAYHRNCVIPRWLLKDISIALAEKSATGDAKNFVELFNPSLEFPLIAIPQVAKALIVSILDHGILPAKTEFEKFMNGIQKYIDQLPRIFTDLESVSDQVREIGKLIIAKAEAEDRQSIAKEVKLTMENFINAVEAYKQQLKEKLMMEIEERKEKFKKEMEQEMSNLEDEAGLEGETLRY
ncbi:hypothetical protein HK098_004551 [Nowakowskiella sp. JEL0407]|nr:hypothetical protein HK098_004551 [Nowakowskiella sp. JEL0407]